MMKRACVNGPVSADATVPRPRLPIVVLLAMFLAPLAGCGGAVSKLTGPEAEALRFLREVMEADWQPLIDATWGVVEGETDREHMAHLSRGLSIISEKDKQVIASLRAATHAPGEEADAVLEYFKDGWIRRDVFSDFMGRWVRDVDNPISSEVARQLILERRVARTPPDKRLDALTRWAIEEPVGGASWYVATHFTAKDALSALQRLVGAPGTVQLISRDGNVHESTYGHFRTAITKGRADSITAAELEQAAVAGPPIARWLAVRTLAHDKNPKAGELAKHLLKEHGDIPFIEKVAFSVLTKQADTRLWLLDRTSRRASEGEFHEENVGSYAWLGGSCKNYRQGLGLLLFAKEHTEDENLLAHIEKWLAEAPKPQAIPDEPGAESEPPPPNGPAAR